MTDRAKFTITLAAISLAVIAGFVFQYGFSGNKNVALNIPRVLGEADELPTGPTDVVPDPLPGGAGEGEGEDDGNFIENQNPQGFVQPSVSFTRRPTSGGGGFTAFEQADRNDFGSGNSDVGSSVFTGPVVLGDSSVLGKCIEREINKPNGDTSICLDAARNGMSGPTTTVDPFANDSTKQGRNNSLLAKCITEVINARSASGMDYGTLLSTGIAECQQSYTSYASGNTVTDAQAKAIEDCVTARIPVPENVPIDTVTQAIRECSNQVDANPPAGYNYDQCVQDEYARAGGTVASRLATAASICEAQRPQETTTTTPPVTGPTTDPIDTTDTEPQGPPATDN